MPEHIEEQVAEENSQYEPVFVARQPIFTTEGDIWGHELLFRHSGDAASATVDNPEQATASVITDGFSIASESTDKGSKFLINFPEQLLLNDAALAMPPEHCIPEVLENVHSTDAVIESIQRLKSAGYTIAIDDFTGQSELEPLLALADIIKVEILGMETPQLIALTEKLGNLNAKLLAEKVEDRETFDLTRALGYSYFQGYFFSKPEVMPGRKISASVVAKLNLLRELANENVTSTQLSGLISTDASLSYRLMRFINSAAFSFMKHIDSIGHGINLMGLGSLRKWLMLVFITDLDPSARSQELALKSIQRAKFLERLTLDCDVCSRPSETMFLFGLFSHLDVLLGMPMQEITRNLPINTEIKNALSGEKNGAAVWLILLQSIESGDWEKVQRILDHYKLDPELTARRYTWAGMLAKKLLGFTRHD